MKKKFFFLFLMTLLLSGCYKDNKLKFTKPADLIPENELADIIKEMDVIQGIVSYNRTHDIKSPSAEQEYYNALFKHYGVTAEQIRQSMSYYISLGKPMADIYDKVLSQFSIEESMLYVTQNAGQIQRLDSTGILRLQFKQHWIYSRDSTIPYSFKPIF
ncbi:MAG: DUF4296 domain-containing protein [Bacteroidales bacterium]|nr:DUF4296 domain-containing protein [Bacteroidales bacterium]